MFIPTREGDIVAQELYDHTNPRLSAQRLKKFRTDLEAHYRHAEPEKCEYMTLRGVSRANLAPLLHIVECELYEHVREQRARGIPLQLPDEAQIGMIDEILECYGKYTGRRLAFLRMAGWHAWQAANGFIQTVEQESGHWARPIWELYATRHTDVVRVSKKEPYAPPASHVDYIREISVAANVTSLDVITPAAVHSDLWAQNPEETTWDILQRNVYELAWPQDMGAQSFEGTFPSQAEGGIMRARCPVSHDSASGRMWRSPSLGQRRLVRQYCPANVDLTSRFYPHYGSVSAATLRTSTNIYFAQATLGA